MPSYKATLTSVGDVNNAFIFLEILSGDPLAVPIFLSPKSANKKIWSNNNINLDVFNLLDYEFRVHAFRGTGWTFKLVNKANGLDVIDIEGETGGDINIGRNISIKIGQVNPNGKLTPVLNV